MQVKKSLTAPLVAAALLITGCSNNATDAADQGSDALEDAVWSTYPTGTNVYADLAGVAEAITQDQGTSIRIVTSDTAIGRLQPVEQGTALISRLGDEAHYAFEGIHEFSGEDWGPQDTRMVWATTSKFGMMVRGDSGIESISDLRGMNVPIYTANPSANAKIRAFLATADLTYDDVELVEVAYSDQATAIGNGEIDVIYYQAGSAAPAEFATNYDGRWLEVENTSDDLLEEMRDYTPSVDFAEFSGIAGQEEGETTTSLSFSAPVVAYADADQEQIYRTVEAIHTLYPEYENVSTSAEAFHLDNTITEPFGMPFHDGTIEYLDEIGSWSDDAEDANAELLDRESQMSEAWDDLTSDYSGDQLTSEWLNWKDNHMESPTWAEATD